MSKRERTDGVRGVFIQILLTLKSSRWAKGYPDTPGNGPDTPGNGADTPDTRTIRAEVRTTRSELRYSLKAASLWILCDTNLSLVLFVYLEH